MVVTLHATHLKSVLTLEGVNEVPEDVEYVSFEGSLYRRMEDTDNEFESCSDEDLDGIPNVWELTP